MRIARYCVAASMLAACAPARQAADTTSAPAVDTLKPSMVPAPAPDTLRAARSPRADSPRAGDSKPAAATTRTSTSSKRVSTRDTAHLGRDSVIRIDPRDPRRQLPTVPPKKPL